MNEEEPAAAANLVRPRHTGRHLVLLKQGTGRTGAEIVRNAAGIRVATSSEFREGMRVNHLAPGEGLLFERLDAAVLHGDPDQIGALAARVSPHLRLIERERFVCASASIPGCTLADRECPTWGLQATRALSSRFTGRGIRVAVLDTGLDLEHPDFASRTIVSQSFVTCAAVDDVNGHGTHCAGIACGPERPQQSSRYGVAHGADLYIAKVLDDDAGGTDASTLAGLEWAVRNGCTIISMSLGSPAMPGDPYSRVFEDAAARALAAGSIVIAPAGNASQRPDNILPVEHPANCPSIMAIAAVNPSLAVASFSNGGASCGAGNVAVAAPGRAILSSWSRPTLYRAANGTSAAAPYVAGIAALLAEANPTCRGHALRELVLRSVQRLTLPARDVGAGLIQAPQ